MRNILFVLVLLTGCTAKKDNVDFGNEEETAYRKYLKELASDNFQGRKPFTEGEEITVNYLAKEFAALGAEPGNGESFFQDVPMVDIKGSFADNKVTLKGSKGKISLEPLVDMVGGTRRVVTEQKIDNLPLVFAGFGIDAPEYNWNDYAGLDVKGKIAVVMINDPGFYNADLFKGKDMTYYGRWTYKFEEAARKGAAGVLIIHDTKPAAYDWSVVRSGWSKSKLFLQTPNDNADFCALEGWLTGESAEKLFKLSGVNGTELIENAKKPGFKAVSLGVSFTGTIKNEIKKSVSKNVIAQIPGTSRKDEYIIYTAHWDHFGIGETVAGDSIYNGAADNATGVAALLALAKKYKENPPVERSVVFLAVTAEEAGLLGSDYYAKNPVFPLKKTVVDINMDVLQPFGKMKDVFLIGKGQSEVDKYLEDAAQKRGITVRDVADKSNGWYYRSDHFSFAKVGVPTLYFEVGVQSEKHGEEWGIAQKADYVKNRYHKPTDEYQDSWDVSGTMSDLQLIYEAGRNLANSDVFPKWNDGVMFKRIREEQK
jgi:Zn-dependent M28 family amino/carboxypeptidase